MFWGLRRKLLQLKVFRNKKAHRFVWLLDMCQKEIGVHLRELTFKECTIITQNGR